LAEKLVIRHFFILMAIYTKNIPIVGRINVTAFVLAGEALSSALEAKRKFLILNVIFLLVLASFFVFYMFTNSYIVSQNYKLNRLKVQLNEVGANLADLGYNSNREIDLEQLSSFAKNIGMIEAIHYEAVFISPGLAQK